MKAVLLEKYIEIPHGGTHHEYHLKLMDLKPGQFYTGYRDDLPDAPARYRGEISISAAFFEKRPAVGDRFQIGPYQLRAISYEPRTDTLKAVLDNWLSFVPVWRRRLYYVWRNICWRLIATAQVWGIMERPDVYDVSVADTRRSLWSYVYAVRRISEFFARFRSKA